MADRGETNAERLQRIDEDKEIIVDMVGEYVSGIELSNSDYAFLYSIANKNLALEENLSTTLRNNQRIRKDNKRLREAVKSAYEELPQGNTNKAIRILGEALEGDKC